MNVNQFTSHFEQMIIIVQSNRVLLRDVHLIHTKVSDDQHSITFANNSVKNSFRAYPEVFFALSHHAILRLRLDEPFPHLLVTNSEIFTNKAFGKTRTLVIKAVFDLVVVFDLEMRASSGASLLGR